MKKHRVQREKLRYLTQENPPKWPFFNQFLITLNHYVKFGNCPEIPAQIAWNYVHGSRHLAHFSVTE